MKAEDERAEESKDCREFLASSGRGRLDFKEISLGAKGGAMLFALLLFNRRGSTSRRGNSRSFLFSTEKGCAEADRF